MINTDLFHDVNNTAVKFFFSNVKEWAYLNLEGIIKDIMGAKTNWTAQDQKIVIEITKSLFIWYKEIPSDIYKRINKILDNRGVMPTMVIASIKLIR